MSKIFAAALLGITSFAAWPTIAEAGPPAFYNGGIMNAPFPIGPTRSGFNYYSSPSGYQSFNNYSMMQTPWGWSGFQSGGVSARPIVNGPMHSVYWNPTTGTYQWSTGYTNTPTIYQQFQYGPNFYQSYYNGPFNQWFMRIR